LDLASGVASGALAGWAGAEFCAAIKGSADAAGVGFAEVGVAAGWDATAGAAAGAGAESGVAGDAVGVEAGVGAEAGGAAGATAGATGAEAGIAGAAMAPDVGVGPTAGATFAAPDAGAGASFIKVPVAFEVGTISSKRVSGGGSGSFSGSILR